MSAADDAYKAAEKKIAEAKAKGATRLSFYNQDEFKALEALPPAIADLKDLTSIDLDGTKVTDLSPLSGLTALRELSHNNSQATDLSPLRDLAAMQMLDLTSSKATDLSPISGLTELTGLSIRESKVANIAPLAHLTKLRDLWIDGSEVEDLRPIAHIDSLIEGAQGGLTALAFENTPATRVDPDGLGRLAEIEDDQERTRETLAYLKGLTVWPPGAKPSVPLPSEPRKAGPSFEATDSGAITLDDPSIGAGDAEQEALKGEL